MNRKYDLSGLGFFGAGMIIFAGTEYFIDLDAGKIINFSAALISLAALAIMLVGSFRTVNYNACFKRSEIFVIAAIIADVAFMGSMAFGLRAGTAAAGYAALGIDLALFVFELLAAAFMLGACSKLAEQSGEESMSIACTNTKTIFLAVSIIAFVIKPCIAFIPGNNNSAFLVLIIMSAVAVLGVNIMASLRFGNVCDLLDGSRLKTENAI
ncbi:MAG: hypothetical protein LKJ83_01860 [Eubacteriaceae bacterium]|jgi:hypothetical protein|nr:hypothetical protein [Eubacteriaceae bacterium]